jgi:hypothetical protein
MPVSIGGEALGQQRRGLIAVLEAHALRFLPEREESNRTARLKRSPALGLGCVGDWRAGCIVS